MKTEHGSDTTPLTIGLLIGSLFDEYEHEIWRSLVEHCVERGIHLVCFDGGMVKLDAGSEHEPYFAMNLIYKMVHRERVDALVVVSSCLANLLPKEQFFQYLDSFKPIPMVSIGMVVPEIPSVVIDNEGGMRELMDHLIVGHGMRHLAFIKGIGNNDDAEARFAVYCECLKKHEIEYREELVLSRHFSYPKAQDSSVVSLLVQHPEVQAIVVVSDFLAVSAVHELTSAGYRIPQDVALVSFDDSEMAKTSFPPLTSVHQSPYELGRQALDLCLDTLEEKSIPLTYRLKTHLVRRSSCGCFTRATQQKSIPFERYTARALDTVDRRFVGTLREQCSTFVSSQTLDSWAVILYHSAAESLESGHYLDALLTLEYCIRECAEKGCAVSVWYPIALQLLIGLESRSVDRKDLQSVVRFRSEYMKTISDNHIVFQDSIQKKTDNKWFETYHLSESLFSSLNRIEFKEKFVQLLPGMGISAGALFLFPDDRPLLSSAELFVAFDNRTNLVLLEDTVAIDPFEILPQEFGFWNEAQPWLVKTLYFKDQPMGYLVFRIDFFQGEIFENLSVMLSNALRNLQLIERIQKHSHVLELQVKDRTSELVAANQELEKLNRVKNDFIANVTHDFRSPLTVTLAASELGMAEEPSSDSNAYRHFRLIYQASLKLKSTIDRFLDLAKMDSAGVAVNVAPVPIRQFMTEIAEFYRNSVYDLGVRLSTEFPVHEVSNFYTDADKLEEILNNLISNAIKFVEPGRGEIILRLIEDPESVRIVVEDNGIGIPPDRIDRVFERFAMWQSSQRSKHKGSGIGLAFSLQLAQYLKGSLEGASDGVGRGARFTLTLPKGQSGYAPGTVLEPMPSSSGLNVEQEYRRSEFRQLIHIDAELHETPQLEVQKSPDRDEREVSRADALILIVDDLKAIRELVRSYLERFGYRNFLLASDGEIGLKAIEDHAPDLVICDFHMPKLSGLEFYETVANSEFPKKPPFLFLTAGAGKQYAPTETTGLPCAWMLKPIEANELFRTVDRLLHSRP